MNKKDNMKQAMYEMFGVGTDQAAKGSSGTKEDRKNVSTSVVEQKAPAPAAVEKKTGTAVSRLAPGTVFEGTLHSDGDVEIAGSFKGDIITEGAVILRSHIQGNVTANSLKLFDCSLAGDVVVKEMVSVSLGSAINGNVTAKDVQCAGKIAGDLKVSEDTALEDTAQVSGSIVTGSISVVKGAVICGGIEIKTTPAPNKRSQGETAPAK